jgi:hypothetical protein
VNLGPIEVLIIIAIGLIPLVLVCLASIRPQLNAATA